MNDSLYRAVGRVEGKVDLIVADVQKIKGTVEVLEQDYHRRQERGKLMGFAGKGLWVTVGALFASLRSMFG